MLKCGEAENYEIRNEVIIGATEVTHASRKVTEKCIRLHGHVMAE